MKKYWDHVEIGDTLLPAAKAPISRLQIAQFAAATDDYSPLNLDDELAKNAGFNSVYAPGLMSLGFVEESLRSFAKNMKILTLNGTFQRLIWPGDLLTAKGLILRRYKKNDEYRVLFSLWCENQNKEVVMKGSSICLLFKNSEQEKKCRAPLPQITAATKSGLKKKSTPFLTGAINQTGKQAMEQKELA